MQRDKWSEEDRALGCITYILVASYILWGLFMYLVYKLGL